MFGLGRIGALGGTGKSGSGSGGGAFSPSSLFSAGEKGVWYDPSDFSTMYQDSAGTTPVTAVEQPVGLVLDKSKGLVLGSELVTNGDFSSSSLTGWSSSNGGTGVVSSGQFIITASGGAYTGQEYNLSGLTSAGKWYVINASLISGTGRITFEDGVGADPATPNIDYTGPINFTFYVYRDNATTAKLLIRTAANGGSSTWDNISIKELPGNHASQSTTTKRPILRQDAGGKYYLEFDGVDDCLVSNTIDFTSTDKMSIFAGVRKSNDTMSIVAELSSSIANDGSFYLVTGTDAGGTGYSSMGKGTAIADAAIASKAFTFNAPETAVLTVTHDIAGDLSTIRRNGVAGTNATADKGSGNFGNYPLYIGQRGEASLPLNGRIYSLIVRGALSTADEISKTEAWVAAKTGVTL